MALRGVFGVFLIAAMGLSELFVVGDQLELTWDPSSCP